MLNIDVLFRVLDYDRFFTDSFGHEGPLSFAHAWLPMQQDFLARE